MISTDSDRLVQPLKPMEQLFRNALDMSGLYRIHEKVSQNNANFENLSESILTNVGILES